MLQNEDDPLRPMPDGYREFREEYSVATWLFSIVVGILGSSVLLCTVFIAFARTLGFI